MMVDLLPALPGIYKITCTVTGKFSIGSAVSIRSRWANHRGYLRRGGHKNARLQNAWHKYGEETFVVSILKLVARPHLLEAEQRWLDETQCFNENIGYNILNLAGSSGDYFAHTWEGFIDPNGNAVVIENLFDFCRTNNLDSPSMIRLAQGKSKLKSHKGWTHINSRRVRDFIKTYEGFFDPSGQQVPPITNLAAFCRVNGLVTTHMVKLAKGKLLSHQGWTHIAGRRTPNNIRTYTGFVNPNGERVTITNLSEFCRGNELDVVHMHELVSGKRSIHKGWTWSESDE